MTGVDVELKLPQVDGGLEAYSLGAPTVWQKPGEGLRSRRAFAAAHVVCAPLDDYDPFEETRLDWEATLAYRRHLWSYGLAVAEAMDTAQRGMGLDWALAQELIRRSLAEARAVGGDIACGAGTDQLELEAGQVFGPDDVLRAYEEQVAFVERHGGQVILMASRALAACAGGPDDYRRVYGRILRQVERPVIIHWLGDMFDPALTGYWGYRDLKLAMEVCLSIIEDNAASVDGIKLSLLDAEREVELRQRLPQGVRMYTGDDFNYPQLIAGDSRSYSHALLGIFDAVAPAASAAIQALDEGDVQRFHDILEPTVPLARHIFASPTYYYKTGIVFLAYLNGHQPHFRMVGGLEAARSVVHLAELFRLADSAGLLRDPELAAERMKLVLKLAGIDA